MKKNRRFSLVNIFLLIVFFLFSFLNIYYIFKNNILNFKNLNYIFLAINIFMLVLITILVLKNKIKIFTTILLLLGTMISGFIFINLNKTVTFFDKINNNTITSEYKMSIAVIKDSAINNLEDIKDNVISAPLKMDKDNIENFLNHLEQDKKLKFTFGDSISYVKSYENLLNGRENVIILNSAYENILELNDPNYAEKIKKIYEYTIKKENKKKEISNQDDDAFNVYISGIDTFGPITTVARSDVNIVMTVNKKTNKILLTTVPRDAYVRIADGGNNQYDKLTHAGVYGIEASMHTLENLYKTDINYYARINFTSFLKLIDLVGGVDIYNEQSFTSLHGRYNFPVGMVHLDSDKALGFVRERYSLAEGDNDRGKNQQKVLTAIIKKLTTTDALNNAEEILNEMANSLQTNMPMDKVMNLVNEQLSKKSEYLVSSQAISGHGEMGLPSYAMPGYNLYMMRLDEGSLLETQQNIKEVLEGR